MEKKILYLECESGISGDMTVAALLDLGADQEALERALQSLPVDGFHAVVSRVKKAGLDMCDFDVVLDQAHENHDHDMEYLHGHENVHPEEHFHVHGEGPHTHGGAHTGEGPHTHGGAHTKEAHHVHGGHAHEHRGLPEILHIIEHADLTERAKETASRIFRILAAAEAKAHGVPEDQVHFHEVGAVDSIVDIVAAAVCLDDLGITDVVVTRLNEGQGTIRCQHGILPVPVPAVMNIAEAHRLPLHVTETKGEDRQPTAGRIYSGKNGDGRRKAEL